MNSFITQDQKDKMAKNYTLSVIFLVLAFVWVISGFFAFVWSIFCFSSSRNGDSVNNIIGLLLAVFFGPFYFIYLLVNKKYCRRINNKNK